MVTSAVALATKYERQYRANQATFQRELKIEQDKQKRESQEQDKLQEEKIEQQKKDLEGQIEALKQQSAAKKAQTLAAAAKAAENVAVAVVPHAQASGNYQALGKQMAIDRGWGAYWDEINFIVMNESGWNPAAQNPHSSACGIAQNINGCGAYPDPSPAGQINWMYNYFQTHCSAYLGKSYCYNGPHGAYLFKKLAGWW